MSKLTLKTRLTPGLLEAIRLRKTTAKAIAAHLNVAEATLCRTLAEIGLERIPAPTMEQKRTSHTLKVARTYHRTQLAHQVKLGNKTVKAAAIEANCSMRTIYRYTQLQIESQNA